MAPPNPPPPNSLATREAGWCPRNPSKCCEWIRPLSFSDWYVYNLSAMSDYVRQYYEQHWSQIGGAVSDPERQRITETIRRVPADCASILDVGCGDGRITNALAEAGYVIVGLERSAEALHHVRSSKVAASIDSLPFSSRSFDLVLCSEVLEHLPYPVYPKALAEMARVASRFILITVPNEQDLESSLVTCPECWCRFEPTGHVRSFTCDSLGRLFEGFILRAAEPLLITKVYPRLVIRAAKPLVNRGHGFPTTAVCPQCGYSRQADRRSCADRQGYSAASPEPRGLLPRLLSSLGQITPHRKAATWILALYQKQTTT